MFLMVSGEAKSIVTITVTTEIMPRNKSEGHLSKRSGVWQARKAIKGKVRVWSTKTPDRELARKRARDHWQAVIAEQHALVDRQASRSSVATLGEVVAAYLGWAVIKPGWPTRRQNANMLRSVVATGIGRWDPAASVHVLDAEMVRRFQAARLAGITAPEALERAKFSANSMLTQARAVFCSAEPWRLAGLKVPDLVEWRKAERFRAVAIDCEFRPFSAAELAAINAGLGRLREEAPAVWLVAALMLYGGLRNSEVRRAQRDWLHERDGQWWVSVRVSKSAMGVRWVPLPPAIAEGVVAQAGDADLIAASNPTERREICERSINGWLRGVLSGRSAYDLRRQAGSWVLDEQGIEAARDFLGHKDSATTRRWYASRVRALRPIGAMRAAERIG